jgi:hypothetical protein
MTYGKHKIFSGVLLSLVMLFSSHPVLAREITLFQTRNQSPLAQIFGLPAPTSAIILSPGRAEGMLAVDAANNFAKNSNSRESVLLDGESYRFTLALRYGIAKKIEGAVEIPYVGQGRGFFDSFIEDWHDFFGLPQGERKQAPRGRLRYVYAKDGLVRLNINDSGFGVGDIRLSAGGQLYHDERENPRAVALRVSLKLPTGSSGELHGSGSTDVSLWLDASDDYKLPIGHLTLFGAAGGMFMSDGDILPEQQRNLAAFGSFGLGWGPAEWIDFKVQLAGHTPFFQQSALQELNEGALQLVFGGSLNFSASTSLDIGVSEDLAVNTSPDIALHLALRRRF